jgi:hypothetical protein
MTKQQKTGAIAGSFVIAGLAIYGLFRLSRMNPADKALIADKLKTKGKDFLNQVKPAFFKNNVDHKNVMEANAM